MSNLSAPPRTPREWAELRKSMLWQERAGWITQWQNVSRRLLPLNGRFTTTDRNKGHNKFNDIIDSTGTRALRVLGAGLMAGMTSPARPWFRLEVGDKDLMKHQPVKEWLNMVAEVIRAIFAKSNTYRSLHTTYEELGAFGTGGNIILPDFDNVIHNYPQTVGEYAIATDHRGEVNTVYREYDMTVTAMVQQFGINKVSRTVRDLYDKGQLDAWVTVTHYIEPRTERDTRKKDAGNMPFKSCYFETGNDTEDFLRVSGFKTFPGVYPRWAVAGGDIYGTSPGMECYGDLGQLRHQQLRKAQAIDYMVKPPLALPAGMKNQQVNTLPGGATYIDPTAVSGAKALFDTRVNLDHLLLDIQDVRRRIDETFYKNLFMMLAQDERSNITAREVAERHEEKLMMLGPVLERLHNELLKPLIDTAFDQSIAAGILPPPPPELDQQELSVDFVSMLAQAQRAIGTGAMDRYVMALGQVATMKPQTLDNFDEDDWAQKYADMLGVDPSIVVGRDQVAIIRQQRAQQQEQMQQAQMQQVAAQNAQTLSQTDTTGQNALTDVISNFSGYSGPGLPVAV